MTMIRFSTLAAVLMFSLASAVFAQEDPAATQQTYDPERRVNLAQPDFTLVALPTSLRVPKFKSAFRVTHRFGRPLGAGDFGDLLENAFGLDSGAQIGLEYRFGIVKGGQVGVHRTSNRTIAFFGQYDIRQAKEDRPLGISAIATIEGSNNFRDMYSPSLGANITFQMGTRGALYVQPIWAHDVNLVPSVFTTLDEDTFMVGVGGRFRIRPTVYVVGEITPRVSGYDRGTHQGSFAIEKRAGGHAFQLNFSNGFGTTMAQIARGGVSSSDWFLGFNISRKFF
jgi:hypothetical protein